jgi:hypothetical protein
MSTNNNIQTTIRFGIARRQFLLTALALLAAFTLIAAFTFTAASAKAGDRPFKGTMVNNDNIVGFTFYPAGHILENSGLFNTLIVAIDGDINGTHLGKGTVSGAVTIDMTGIYFGGCSSVLEGTTGTIDFTAANGDVVNMEMTLNQLCPISGTEGVFTGQYNVTGGTGRFSGADGVIDVTAVIDFTAPPGAPSVNTLSGTIVY